jgi:hypothetical protein
MGKTLKYVSEFTFPSSSSKPMATGYAKGGMAMGGMKSTKPAASPAPKSSMLYSKAENTAKTLLADGKGAPMPHAKGSVNKAAGGRIESNAAGNARFNAMLANTRAANAGNQIPANTTQPPVMGVPGRIESNAAGNARFDAMLAKMPMQAPQGAMPGRLPQAMPKQMSQGPMPGQMPGQMSQGPMTQTQARQAVPGQMAKGGAAKVGKVMGEFKAGELHSGSKSGPVVKSRKQAVAIGLSEARKAAKK